MKEDLVRTEVLKYTDEEVAYHEENNVRIVTILKSGKELVLAPTESAVAAVKRALAENAQRQES